MNGTAMNGYDNQVIGVAFGNPMGFATFSGYSRHLFTAIKQIGGLADTFSSKQIKPCDILTGCVNLRRIFHGKRPDISASWLWNPATVYKFSRRLALQLKDFPEDVPVLQVGTHVYPYKTARPFYCVTDMTVKQAVIAGQFRIKHLNTIEVNQAIQVQKRMFDSNEKIFVLCEWTRASIIEDYGQDPQKVIVIGAGANMPALEPSPQKFLSREILFVGYDWHRKGGPLLLEAFRLVKQKVAGATLNIVGCRPDIKEDGVNIIGSLQKVQPQDMARLENLYTRAQCFCILPEFDPFPNVLLEAQINSTPVVSFKNGSRCDAVRDGLTGILVERTNAQAVAEALVYILSNSDKAQKMGQAAKKFVTENYTWPSIAKKIMSHIFEQHHARTVLPQAAAVN